MDKYLRIAASQFPVSHDMVNNYKYIKKLTEKASKNDVDVVQFPETALPGYRSISKGDPSEFDWNKLESLTNSICDIARLNNVWVLLGTIRKMDAQLPRNSICVISNNGEIIGYYDKQRIYRKEVEYYSPGNTPFVVEIKGHKCGFLICYDNSFPELYKTYREMGVGLLFHSFYNVGSKQRTGMKNLMDAYLIMRSNENQMWTSASNSSKPYSPLQATIARPDGTTKKAKRHVTSIVIEDYPKAKLGWTH